MSSHSFILLVVLLEALNIFSGVALHCTIGSMAIGYASCGDLLLIGAHRDPKWKFRERLGKG